MNLRSKLAVGLIAGSILILLALQISTMPGTEHINDKDVANIQDPFMEDFDSISQYRNKYMGNASNLTGLFYQLPLRDLDMSFKLHPEAFTAEVNYKAAASEVDAHTLDRALIYNATAAFALIENLEAVAFNFEGSYFKLFRSDVERWYGVELGELAEAAAWRDRVQDRLKDEAYVQECLNAIVAHEERSVADTLKAFYEDTGEAIIIYDEMPFEGGNLVLAEKLAEGEHYPDLHFIDRRGKVEHITRGSNCWTLNYTAFKGHYIYYGLAGVEERRYDGSREPVERLEMLFSDRVASVSPRESIVEHINPKENDTRVFDEPQGYILPVEGRELPSDFIFVLKGGERKSIFKLQMERSMENMPDYLKSKAIEVYNSFAFSFSPMLTPREWNKGYKEGEICLEGSTDANGNRNVLQLRPAGHMSPVDSFILPQDIKPLYLSYNYDRTADFGAGEAVTVKYPGGRHLVDCRILMLTGDKVTREIGQDSLKAVEADAYGRLVLPKDNGYYLFLLRTEENNELQTYTGMIRIR
jgi:hypothetical protein